MNYRVLIADEALADIFGLVQYIHTELCNPDAAEKLYDNLNRETKNMGDFPLKFSDSGIKYRGYIIFRVTINKCGQNNAFKSDLIWKMVSLKPLIEKILPICLIVELQKVMN